MAFQTGIFNVGFNPSELNARSFAGTLLRLFPNGSAPLFALSSMLGKSVAKQATHSYFTKTLSFGSVVINGALTTETTLVVDSTTGILPKMVLFNKTSRENMRVISVVSATQLTVTRAFGRITVQNIADNEELVVVGTAFEEGSSRPIARGLVTINVPNYTQIFRNAWALTDTARASLSEMGFSNIQENKEDCMMLHGVDAEAAIFFGQAKMDTTGSTPLHATQGIIDAVEQYADTLNSTTAGATTNYAQLITMLEPMWKYSTNLGNPKERIMFAGATACKVFNDIGRKSGVVTLSQDDTTFGMQFTKFKFYKGQVNIVEHPLFNGIPGMSGLAVIVDMAAVKLAYMNGRDTRPEEYGGDGRNNANGVDAVGGSLTTEFAVELINPHSCGVIYGLTAGIQEAILTDEIPPG